MLKLQRVSLARGIVDEMITFRFDARKFKKIRVEFAQWDT